MRYEQDFLENLKRQTDIVRLAQDYVELKKKGNNWWACCPFHGEKTASFSVNPKGFYYCFGCLEENELIWTSDGLKPIGEIRFQDKVLDKFGQWQEVINVIYKKADFLLGITTASFRKDPLWLTTDHTCIFARRENVLASLPYIGEVSRGFKLLIAKKRAKRSRKYLNALKLSEGPASELKIGDYLAFPVIPEHLRKVENLKADGVINPRENRVNGVRVAELPVNERTARLYGLWVAEGSLGRGFVRWTFNLKEERTLAAEVVSTLKDEFGLEAKIYKHAESKNVCEVNCSKTDLALQLAYWFGRGAQQKKIPAEALYWSISIQKAFLSGYRDGDADRNNLSASISRKLSYGIFALAIQAKESISLARNDGYTDVRGQSHKEFWFHYPRSKENANGFYESVDGTDYYFSPIKEIKQSEGVNNVVDITVSETNSFTTKMAVVHNCGKKGSAFNFVMEMENVSFGEAVRIIAEKQGVKLPAPQPRSSAEEQKFKEQQKAAEVRKKDAEIVVQLNSWALEFWENHLQENNAEAKAAREYLEKRGLTDETRQTFRLGYAPDRWDALLNYLKSKGADAEAIEKSGLMSKNEEKNRIYDRFRGRVIFPVLDIAGKPIAFGARTMGDGEPKYLNSPETAAYTKGDNLYGLYQNAAEIRRRKFAILVEGYLDLLTPFQNGVRTCAASLGTALTQNQARLLSRFCKKVVINYDGDKAGIKAAKRAVEVLLAEDFEVKVLVLPEGADPDDFIRKNGVTAYNEQRGKRSQTFAPFVLAQAADGRDFRNSPDKQAALEDVLPFLRVVKSPIQKREFFDDAMNRFQIDEAHRGELLKSLQLTATNQSQTNYHELKQQISQAVQVKPTVAEQELLELLLHDAELREMTLPALEPPDYEHLASAKIFNALFELQANGVEVNAENLQNLSGESDLLSIVLLSDDQRAEDEAIDDYLLKAQKCVISLRTMAIDRRLREIKDEIVTTERNGENERFNHLLTEQLELSRLRLELSKPIS